MALGVGTEMLLLAAGTGTPVDAQVLDVLGE